MVTADILFVGSDWREFTGAMRFWDKVEKIDLPVQWARKAMRKGRPIVAVANGAGWESAGFASTVAPHRKLCNIGFCGALDPTLNVGDVVVSSGHLPVTCSRAHTTGSVVSSRRVVSTVEEKRRLFQEGHVAVEMESAGIDQPFYCIKSVSDVAGHTFVNDFQSAILPNGKISTMRVLSGALRDPFRRFPELIRFARNSAAASESLGEFLDACSF